MADFICSVYYDNFAKTVLLINSSINMFTKKEFIKEVAGKMPYGFLITAHKLDKTNSSPLLDDTLAKSSLISAARDIVQFKINAEVTIK